MNYYKVTAEYKSRSWETDNSYIYYVASERNPFEEHDYQYNRLPQCEGISIVEVSKETYDSYVRRKQREAQKTYKKQW